MFRKIIFITAVITASNWELTSGRRLSDYDPNTINIDSDSLQNGFYGYSYSSVLDGISAHESGYIKNPKAAKKDQISAKKGCYSFSSPEGAFISVLYVADERGYRPVTRITYPSQATHIQHLAEPCASLEQPVQIPGASSSTSESVGRDDQNFEVTPKPSTSTTEPNLEEVIFTTVNSVTSESIAGTGNEDLNTQITLSPVGPSTVVTPEPTTVSDSIGETSSEPTALSTGADSDVDGSTSLADSAAVTRQTDGTTVPTTLGDSAVTHQTDRAPVSTTLASSVETTQTDSTTVPTTLADFVVKTQTDGATVPTTLADSIVTHQTDGTTVATTLADYVETTQTDGATVATTLADFDVKTQTDGTTGPTTLIDFVETTQTDSTNVPTTLADFVVKTQTDGTTVPASLGNSAVKIQTDGTTVPTSLGNSAVTHQTDGTTVATTLADYVETTQTDGATVATTLADFDVITQTDGGTTGPPTLADSVVTTQTDGPTVPTTLADSVVTTQMTTDFLSTNLNDSGLPTTGHLNNVTATTLALTTPPIETNTSEEILDYDAVVTYVRHSRAVKF